MSRFTTPELGSIEEAQALLSAIIASSDDAIISKDLSRASFEAGTNPPSGYSATPRRR